MEEKLIKSPIVETEFGKIEGKEEDGCYKYFGIPFAKPPLNELTFKHPIKPDPWEGIYKAYYGKKNPIQGSGILNCENIDLDCLYLNIYKPKNDDNTQKLPVLVWIFGGSFKSGGSGEINETTHEMKYDATLLAKETNSIVVTINYRLNLYGFLNLHFLDKNFDYNNGLYDQKAALEFIYNNISNFNGDKNNITLIGQSAGAASIIALLSIKKIENLFSKAIILSPVINHFFNEKESHKITLKYLKYLKIKKNELDKLYSLDSEIVKKANSKLKMYLLKKGDNRCAFSPIIDKELLLDYPSILAINSKKTILIGNVINESNLFIFSLPKFLLFPLTIYMKFDYKRKYKKITYNCYEALTSTIYKKPIYKLLSSYEGKAYKYEFRFISPYLKKKNINSFHAYDVPLLFHFNTSYLLVDDEKSIEIGKKMREIINKFIYDDFDEFEEYKKNKKEIIIE